MLFFQDYFAGRLDIHDYVRFATEAVVQRGPQAAAAAHQRFMDEIIRPAIRPAAIELVRRHQQAGDVVVITSATNEFVTRPIAQAFGVDRAHRHRTGTRPRRLADRGSGGPAQYARRQGGPPGRLAGRSVAGTGAMWRPPSTATP